MVMRRAASASTMAGVRVVSGCGSGAIEMNALVRAVPAGGVAELAADAVVFVDARDDLVVEVEVLPLA